MSLNIKNPRAYELARQLATMKGISMTQALMTALQHEIEYEARRNMEEENKRNFDIEEKKRRIAEIVASFKAMSPRDGMKPLSTANMDDGIYDEGGLPI